LQAAADLKREWKEFAEDFEAMNEAFRKKKDPKASAEKVLDENYRQVYQRIRGKTSGDSTVPHNVARSTSAETNPSKSDVSVPESIPDSNSHTDTDGLWD